MRTFRAMRRGCYYHPSALNKILFRDFHVRARLKTSALDEERQSVCANRGPRTSRTGPGHLAGHSAADGYRGGGLHSIALSGRANACAFLAVLSPPPLLPTHRPASLV